MTSQSTEIDMNTELRTLCADLAGHLTYMHAQMEEANQYSELEDYYWYRESVKLLKGTTKNTGLPWKYRLSLRSRPASALANGRGKADFSWCP